MEDPLACRGLDIGHPALLGGQVRSQDGGPGAQGGEAGAVAKAVLQFIKGLCHGIAAGNNLGPLAAQDRDSAVDGVSRHGQPVGGQHGELRKEATDVAAVQDQLLQAGISVRQVVLAAHTWPPSGREAEKLP
jgi:hypothetical protein